MPPRLTQTFLRLRALTLRGIAGQADSPEAIALLSAEADQIEAEADLLELGGDKPEIIGPPKPPARPLRALRSSKAPE
jgi:hypothetical protein